MFAAAVVAVTIISLAAVYIMIKTIEFLEFLFGEFI
jgi:hypothetical protein